MKLNYLELLASTPIYIPNVGGIISPTLQSIVDIGSSTYEYYINILLMDTEQIFKMLGKEDFYNVIPNEEKAKINVFDIMTANPQTALALQNTLQFFFEEDVVFSEATKTFEVKSNIVIKNKETGETSEKYETIGIINKDNYSKVLSVICQRNNIGDNAVNDMSKAKGKKALAILEKLKKGREDAAKKNKTDKNMELGNIISAVANKHPSLNISNIWSLTVYQLWDCFARLTKNNIIDANMRSVSVWGTKDKNFDFNEWFKKLDN